MINKDAPNPGSDAAIYQGCICPIADNAHGDPELGRTRGFWIIQGCPVHNMTGRKPRKEEDNEPLNP